MPARLLEEVKRWLDEVLERFRDGKRRGLVVTLLAVARLRERGEEITPESVAREARKIMEERPDVDWGVDAGAYDAELAGRILEELVEAGVVEAVDPLEPHPARRYRVKSYPDGDPVAEIYARFGSLLLYGGPHPGARA